MKKKFVNTYKFANQDINKFIFLLQKSVCPYKYIDDWEKFNETSLPEKEGFYSHLNMKDISDADYKHGKRVCKDFKIKALGEYHDLYVQIDTLFFGDVFNNFRNRCLKIYELDPAKFLSVLGLAWQAALKKAKVKLNLLTDIDMLLMIKKGIRGGICHAIHRYVKANNKYMKDHDKNKVSSYSQYWDVNNLYRWVMSQELPINGFEWVTEESDKGYFLEVDVQYPEKLPELHNHLPFLQNRIKIQKFEKLAANLHDKKNMLLT